MLELTIEKMRTWRDIKPSVCPHTTITRYHCYAGTLSTRDQLSTYASAELQSTRSIVYTGTFHPNDSSSQNIELEERHQKSKLEINRQKEVKLLQNPEYLLGKAFVLFDSLLDRESQASESCNPYLSIK